jgi:hypothetical protein
MSLLLILVISHWKILYKLTTILTKSPSHSQHFHSKLSDEDKLKKLMSYNNGDTEAINPLLTFIDNSALLRGGRVHGI